MVRTNLRLALMAATLLLAGTAQADVQTLQPRAAILENPAHWVCRCTCATGVLSFELDSPGKCDGSEEGSSCETADGELSGELEGCHNVLIEGEAAVSSSRF